MDRSYSEMIKISSFEDRFDYLSLSGVVGDTTFGGHRCLNQILYKTNEWKTVRRKVILRDNGCDLAHEDHVIYGSIYIHHINPISIEDILNEQRCVFDPENLVCCSFRTHNAIHYGSMALLPKGPAIRSKNDTCPWR